MFPGNVYRTIFTAYINGPLNFFCADCFPVRNRAIISDIIYCHNMNLQSHLQFRIYLIDTTAYDQHRNTWASRHWPVRPFMDILFYLNYTEICHICTD